MRLTFGPVRAIVTGVSVLIEQCKAGERKRNLWDKGGVDGRTKEARNKKRRGQRTSKNLTQRRFIVDHQYATGL